MYKKHKDKMPALLAAIIITLIGYFLARFLAGENTLTDVKNLSLIFLFSCIWIYFICVYRDQRRYLIYLWVIFVFLGLSVPIIGRITGPHVLRLVMRDLLFYVVLPLCVLPVPLVTSSTVIRKICLVIFMFFTGLALLVTSIVWVYYFSAHTKISADSLVAVLQTGWQETREFLAAYFSAADYVLFLLVFFAVLAVIYVLLRKICINYKAEKQDKRMIILIGAVCLSCGMLFGETYVAHEFKEAFNTYNEIEAIRKNRENNLKKCDDKVHAGVGSFALIIGETHTRTHMSAYGYERDTTPWLKEQCGHKEIILLKNGFACDALTTKVLELALTEKSQYNKVPLNNAMTIVEMARHAGYRIVWITNQDGRTAASLVSMQADEIVWINKSRHGHDYWIQKNGGMDGDVVQKMDALQKPNQKTLYVIHLLGSHQVYRYRYPEEFKVWDENGGKINTYDNSILYNDYVMGELQRILFNKLDVDGMLYFADHGEEVTKFFRHGTDFFLSNYKTESSVQDIVKIPIYMCFSKKYKENFPKNIKNLKRNCDKYFSNDMIYDTLLGLMNIRCQHYNPKQDISADGKYNFNKNILRIMHGKVKITEIE